MLSNGYPIILLLTKLSVLALDIIYGGNGPRNAPNAHANLLEEMSVQWHESCTSITVLFWQAKKAKLGILLGFYWTGALERFAISHFAWGKPQDNPNYERTEQPLHVINPKCLAHLKRWRTRVVRSCREGQFWRPKKIIKVRGMILSTKYLEFDPFRAFLAVFDLTLKVPFQVTRIEEMITN